MTSWQYVVLSCLCLYFACHLISKKRKGAAIRDAKNFFGGQDKILNRAIVFYQKDLKNANFIRNEKNVIEKLGEDQKINK